MYKSNLKSSTAPIWDNLKTDHHVLIQAISSLLVDKDIVKILALGSGRGRGIRDLLAYLENDQIDRKIEAHLVECELKYALFFAEWLNGKGYSYIRTSHDSKTIILEKKTIRVLIFNTTIEKFLTEEKYHGNELSKSDSRSGYDLIMCLLVLQYLPHCFLHVLETLYKLLNENGTFIVDKLYGLDDDDQDIMPFVDANVFKTLKYNSKHDEWYQFYVKRLFEEGAFWGSVVKGTDINLIVNCLYSLFKKHEILHVHEVEKVKLGESHLPWLWGSGIHRLSLPEGLRNVLVKPLYEFHIFSNKKSIEIDQEYWKLCKQASLAKAMDNLSTALWFVDKKKPCNFDETKHFIDEVLPSVVLQLLVSCGILRFDSNITSFYLAMGITDPKLSLTKLGKLFIAINDLDGTGDARIQRWLQNYFIYAHIQSHPLSGEFISSGKKVIISSSPFSDVDGYTSIVVPTFSTVNIPTADNISQPAIKKVLWGKIIDITREQGVMLSDLDKQQLVDYVSQIKSLATNTQGDKRLSQFNDTLKSSFPALKPVDMLPLSLFLESFNTLLFIPFPSYFEQGIDGKYQTKPILGIGLTVGMKDRDALNKQTLAEIQDFADFSQIILSRLADNYLTYRWIENSRKASLESAVAAIMARNMSHNIGSHVSPRATVEAIDQRLDELFTKE